MITDQCISVTDLKRNASALIKSLKKEGSKIVFINNKPVAVLADIESFDISMEGPFQFQFGDQGIDPKVILQHFDK